MSFEEFRKQYNLEQRDTPISDNGEAATAKSQSPYDPLYDRDHVLNKLFRRRKNQRLHGPDDIEGPLYTDPNLPEKLRDPKKCTF